MLARRLARAARAARRPIVPLVVANALSLTGNVVAAVAVPWLVLSTTGSAALTGLVVFAGAGSAALGGLAAGRIVDRIGAGRASAVSDALSALAILPLPVLLTAGALELWHVLGLVAAGTLVDAAGAAARQGMLPTVATQSGIARERANALFTSAEHAGYLLGAPIAGILIALVGSSGALLVTMIAFVAASLLVTAAVRVPAAAAGVGRSDAPSLRRALLHVHRDPALRALVVFPAAKTMLIGPLVPIILPVYAATVYGDPVVLGLLVASYGVGGLAGTLLYGGVATRVKRRTAYLVMACTWPVLYGVLAAQPGSAVAAGILIAIGAMAGFLVPMMATIRQERVPPELLPRVIALSTGIYPVITPISVLVAGLLLDAAGPGGGIAILTLGTLALAAVEMTSAGVRAFDAESGSHTRYGPPWPEGATLQAGARQ